MRILQPTISGSLILSGSQQITGSLNVLLGITGSLQGTASWAGSASFSVTSSYAMNSIPAFPYNGNAVITGSLIASGSTSSTQILIGSSSLFVSSSGNVGVGTTNPIEKFVIEGDGTNIVGQTNILLNSKSTLSTGYSSIIFKNTNASTTVAEIKAIVGSGYSTNTLGLFVQGSERINVSNTGVQFLSASVNLLTVSSSSVISISGSINFPNNASAYNVPQIRLRDYVTGVTLFTNDMVGLIGSNIGVLGIKGAATPYTILKSTTIFGWGNAEINGAIDSGFSRVGAGRLALGNGSSNSITGELTLAKIGVNVSAPTFALEVAGATRLTGSALVTGSLIVTGSAELTGSLSILGSTTISSGLTVGAINPTTTVGRIEASNDIVAYSTSDKRFKQNIKPISNAVDKLVYIGGYEFDWLEDPTYHGNKGHDVGVIAQEIETILPEIVATRDSGYKAVRYEKIIPLLIQAVKEQQDHIKDLQNKINSIITGSL